MVTIAGGRIRTHNNKLKKPRDDDGSVEEYFDNRTRVKLSERFVIVRAMRNANWHLAAKYGALVLL
jgi:hypothetical protein